MAERDPVQAGRICRMQSNALCNLYPTLYAALRLHLNHQDDECPGTFNPAIESQHAGIAGGTLHLNLHGHDDDTGSAMAL